MTVVELYEGWQGGPVSIEVQGDVIASENGEEVSGVILRIDTAADLGAGDEFEMTLGAGWATVTIPENTSSRLRFSVAGTDDQIRALIAALEAALRNEA